MVCLCSSELHTLLLSPTRVMTHPTLLLPLILPLFCALLAPGDCRMIPDPLSAPNLPADTCSECTGLLHMSHNMISGSQTKVLVYDALQSLCQSLPPAQASHCHRQVNTHLAKALQSPSPAKCSENCELLGLCAAVKKDQGSRAVTGSRSEKGQFSPVCSLCVLVIQKLERLLPQNMTEDAIRALLQDVCSLVPQSYKDQCDDFVQKYGDAIVDFLMSSAAPHTICTLLHLCLFSPAPDAPVLSDCDSCRSLSVLSRIHLGLNQSEPRIRAFLREVCTLHPQAVPKCQSFTRVYSSQLLQVLGPQPSTTDTCEGAGLCAPQGEVLGDRRCSWGPSYWCRDVKTAQECGNQAFCKKFVWK